MSLDTRPCPVCRLPELPDYPHRHDRPVRADYDPMPTRPARLYCGTIDRNAYWTAPDWRPECCLVHVVSSEYRAELPELIHAGEGIFTRLEPIPLGTHLDESTGRYVPDLAGPTLSVPDRGRLGGWPWASPAARRFGGVTMLDGEQTLNARDYRPFPWAYVLERRLPGHCRRRHVGRPDRWPEHDGGELCVEVLHAIVVVGVPPEHVAIRRRIPVDRMRDLLDDSLRWAWRRVSESLNELDVGRRRRPSESPAA